MAEGQLERSQMEGKCLRSPVPERYQEEVLGDILVDKGWTRIIRKLVRTEQIEMLTNFIGWTWPINRHWLGLPPISANNKPSICRKLQLSIVLNIKLVTYCL
jgi:hypothetical protein